MKRAYFLGLLLACACAGPAATADASAAADAAGTDTAADDSVADAAGSVDTPVTDAPADAAGDVSPAALGPPSCPAGAPPKLCFTGCEPGPQTAVTPLAKPDPKACPPATPQLVWDGDGTAPPPTMPVELGVSDPVTGVFVPYKDGQWAPIVHGVQGGIHVWAGLRAALPKSTPKPPAKILVEMAGRSLLGCQPVAAELSTKMFLFAESGPPPGPASAGWWSGASTLAAGVPVAFSENEPLPYCGKWIELRVEVRLPGTTVWGVGSTWLRLYDLANQPI